MLREPFSSLIVAFPERRTEWVGLLVPLVPRKGVILLLGSITLIPPTVFMKPLSYLKVTVNMSLRKSLIKIQTFL